jgi:hypothetical protein
MNPLNLISDLSVRELHELQDAVLSEMQRRNVLVGDFSEKNAGRQALGEMPADAPEILGVAKRRPRPLSPRRRAA